MNQPTIIVAVIFLFGISLISTQAGAEEASPPTPYSGELGFRSTFTGDWGGARNYLANKGVIFDLSLTQVIQGILGGGKSEAADWGARGNFTITADTQKLGLWPGGFLMLEFEGNVSSESSFADSVNGQTGALMAVNTNQLFPFPSGNNLNAPAWNITQFLSPYFGLFLGKIDTTSGDMNEFAHGKGDYQFFNLAFNFNPVSLLIAPYSTLGGGVIVLPTKDPAAANVNFSVLQTNGTADFDSIEDLSGNKLTFSGEARVRTNLFFGLTGHQLIGGGYSNQTFTSLSQNVLFIIQNGALEPKKGSWNFYYNFDQYLYETKKSSGQGVGLFGRFGVSDGNPNPSHYFFSIGIGGKGIVPTRPVDSFGIGWYYIVVGHPQFTSPIETRSFGRDEQGFEAYYNLAITPWMRLTPDIQVISPAQRQVVSIGGPPLSIVNQRDINTAIVAGLRLQVIF